MLLIIKTVIHKGTKIYYIINFDYRCKLYSEMLNELNNLMPIKVNFVYIYNVKQEYFNRTKKLYKYYIMMLREYCIMRTFE